MNVKFGLLGFVLLLAMTTYTMAAEVKAPIAEAYSEYDEWLENDSYDIDGCFCN